MMENQILKTKLEIDNVKKKQMIGDGRGGGDGVWEQKKTNEGFIIFLTSLFRSKKFEVD